MSRQRFRDQHRFGDLWANDAQCEASARTCAQRLGCTERICYSAGTGTCAYTRCAAATRRADDRRSRLHARSEGAARGRSVR